MTWRRTTVNSGAGTVPITPATGMGSQIVRTMLTLSAAGTIDFRDGNSNSLNGGPLALAAGQPFSLSYAGSGEDDAWANPIALTGPFGSGTGGFLTGAALDWDFQNGAYQPALGLTVARASVAYEDDNSGNWTSFANNVARITNKGLLVEESRTNGIRNNSMQGAVVGTPGTLPTNWVTTGLAGLTQQIVGVGTQSGIDYIDLRLFGTSTGTTIGYVFDANTAIAAATAQTWSGSLFVALVGGSFANVVGISQRLIERDSGGVTVLVNNGITFLPSITGSLTRTVYTVTLSGGVTTAFIQSSPLIAIANGAAIDFTLRIGWPQLEQGAFATSPIRTTAAAVTRAADVVTVTSPPVFGSAYTLFAAVMPPVSAPIVQVLLSADDTTTGNRSQLYRLASTALAAQVNGGANAIAPGATGGVLTKFVGAFALNDVIACRDGQLSAGLNSVTPSASPPINTLHIGCAYNAQFQLNGYITRAAVWPSQRLPNATLQQLTSPGPTTSNGINLVITGGTCTGYVDYAIAGSG